MKVLFLSHQADYIYGGEVVTLAFLRELRRQGVETHFALPAGPYFDRAKELAITHEIPSQQFRRNFAGLPRLAKAWLGTRARLQEIVSAQGIEILHATSLKAMVYAAPLASKLPVIWHHHDILPASLSNDAWVRFLARFASKILAPSAATRGALLAAGVDSSKAVVLRNGFPLQQFQPRPPRRDSAALEIGVVGEISRRKGSDRIETILDFLNGMPARLTVVGEGLSELELARSVRERLETKGARFLGRLSDLKPVYQEMDLLLVPSRQDPLPTVIVEAGLSGVPVVAARVGGIPEMVQDGVNGYLFSTEEEAAQAIRRVKENWLSLADGARRTAESLYDIAKLTRDLRSIYGDLAGRK